MKVKSMEERPSHLNPIVVTFSRKSRLFPDCSLVKQSVYSGVFVKAHVLCICDCLQLAVAPKSVSANHILNCPSSKSGFLCVIWFSKTWNPSQRWWWCEEVWRWGLSNFCVKAGLPVGSCENPSQVIWLFFCTKQSLRVSRPPVRDMIRWL